MMNTERSQPGPVGSEEVLPPPPRPKIRLLGREIALPQSRPLRIAIGVLLVLLGCLGFLPVLGFWMVPLGLFVLSLDFPSVRRRRRRMEVWWARRRAARNR